MDRKPKILFHVFVHNFSNIYPIKFSLLHSSWHFAIITSDSFNLSAAHCIPPFVEYFGRAIIKTNKKLSKFIDVVIYLERNYRATSCETIGKERETMKKKAQRTTCNCWNRLHFTWWFCTYVFCTSRENVTTRLWECIDVKMQQRNVSIRWNMSKFLLILALIPFLFRAGILHLSNFDSRSKTEEKWLILMNNSGFSLF